MTDLKMLFEPIQIGSMKLKNRTVMAPMGVCLSNMDGTISDAEIAFYRARAEGGFALIRLGVVNVHPSGLYIPGLPALSSDEHISSWEKLVKALHEFDAKVMPQLHHAGNKSIPEILGAQPLGPSPISYPVPRPLESPHFKAPVAKELVKEQIEEIVEAHVEAARRARDAGCDGVELHGGHGYLLGQFMSPAENKRTDEYGGGIEGRLRLSLDIVKRIREKLGDFPILFRINGDEMIPDGLTIEEMQLVAWLLTNAGVDCIDVSRGSLAYSMEWIIPPAGLPPATWITQNTQLIKQAVNVPVIASGRITDPHMAEFILRTGKADLIDFGRPSLADPELPDKAAKGNLDDIRYCMGCLGCVAEMGRIRCTLNPEAGHELELLPPVPAEKPKKVLVAGGGPGGLEVARVAALRGHEVTLYEKSDRLGGQFWIGALSPGRQELTRGIKYFSIQARKAGAKIELGTEVTPSLIAEQKPDVVVVATGGAPVIPGDIAGVDKSHVVTAIDVLTEKVSCGNVVVVLGAGLVGCEVADWLGLHHKSVTIVKMRPGTQLAEDGGIFIKPWLLDRLAQWKVRVVAGVKDGVKVLAIGDSDVTILKDSQQETLLADTVVLALGARPVNELAHQINDLVSNVYVIGDAEKPRQAIDAICEGAKVAREI